jgi:hypothetical protein
MSQLARPDFDPNAGFTRATLACLGLRPKSLRERQGQMARESTKAVAYLRTSSRTNVGPDKDSDKRHFASIEANAKTAGLEIVATFYDAAVSGAGPGA